MYIPPKGAIFGSDRSRGTKLSTSVERIGIKEVLVHLPTSNSTSRGPQIPISHQPGRHKKNREEGNRFGMTGLRGVPYRRWRASWRAGCRWWLRPRRRRPRPAPSSPWPPSPPRSLLRWFQGFLLPLLSSSYGLLGAGSWQATSASIYRDLSIIIYGAYRRRLTLTRCASSIYCSVSREGMGLGSAAAKIEFVD